MIWWFLIVALAAGAVLWAGLAAYIQVRDRMKRTQHPHADSGTEADVGHH